jgi:isoleucyl-tRNA synthetase
MCFQKVFITKNSSFVYLIDNKVQFSFEVPQYQDILIKEKDDKIVKVLKADEKLIKR